MYARWDGLAQVVVWRYARRTATITVYVDLLLAKKIWAFVTAIKVLVANTVKSNIVALETTAPNMEPATMKLRHANVPSALMALIAIILTVVPRQTATTMVSVTRKMPSVIAILVLLASYVQIHTAHQAVQFTVAATMKRRSVVHKNWAGLDAINGRALENHRSKRGA